MDVENALISVIVPVYNTSQYLPVCIESILCQTYKNLEIILIDDGSTDSSGEICDKYAQKDPRIKVIHKKNAGVSAARNDALKIMTGEYVGFVDSDDTVSPNMYEELYLAIVRSDADIAVCGYKSFRDDFDIPPISAERSDNPSIAPKEGIVALSELLSGKSFNSAVWNKLFKADISNALRFNENIKVAEDFLFVVDTLIRSFSVCIIDRPLYFYRARKSSIIHTSYNEDHLTSHLSLVSAIELLKESGLYDRLRYEADTATLMCNIKIMKGLCENKALRAKYAKRSVKEIKKHLNKKSFSNLSASAKKHAILICMGPSVYFSVQRLLKPKK